MSRRGLLLFAAMSVIWGIPYLFIRIAVGEVSPATLVFARTAIGAAILLPVALARTDLRTVLRHWPWVVAFAVVEVAIPWVLLASAEQRISSSLAGLLIAGVPLVGALIAVVIGGAERLGRGGLLGLVVGMLGVAAIVGADFEANDPLALLQMAVVVVGYALGPWILSRRLAGVSSLGVMSLSLALCAAIYAPIAALEWPSEPVSFEAIISIVVLGSVCTAAAFVLFAALIDDIGPVRATLITYVNPAVAAVLGVTVLGEAFTLGMGVGLVLVLLGSALASRPRRGTGHGSDGADATAGRPEPLDVPEVAPS
jgi:drug/metabolite transporter (DMT)-like permease